MRRPFAHGLLIATLVLGGVVVSRADDVPGDRGVCAAKGPLFVTQTNEVRFWARGSCGLNTLRLYQTLGPFQYRYPTWRGGCGYGPGPFPWLRIRIEQKSPAGDLIGWRETWWYFPDLVIGDHRAAAPNSTSRVIIYDVVDDFYGRPTAVGPHVGDGVLLTRLNGNCRVRNRTNADSNVYFVLYGALPV